MHRWTHHHLRGFFHLLHFHFSPFYCPLSGFDSVSRVMFYAFSENWISGCCLPEPKFPMAEEEEQSRCMVPRKDLLKTRCALSTFIEKVKEVKQRLTRAHWKIIDKLPFAHFFYLNSDIRADDYLLDTLIGSFDNNLIAFKVGSKVVPFTMDEMCLILGLRKCGDEVSFKGSNSSTRERYLKGQKLEKEQILRAIDITLESNDVQGAVKLLVLALFVCFLFPTTGARISPALCSYVDDLKSLGKYCWGAAAYDFLMKEIPKKSSSIEQRNKGSKPDELGYLRGCTQVLQVWVREHSSSAWVRKMNGGSPRILNWDMSGKTFVRFLKLNQAQVSDVPLNSLPFEQWLLNSKRVMPSKWLSCIKGSVEDNVHLNDESDLTIEILKARNASMEAELKSNFHLLRAKDLEIQLLKDELKKLRDQVRREDVKEIEKNDEKERDDMETMEDVADSIEEKNDEKEREEMNDIESMEEDMGGDVGSSRGEKEKAPEGPSSLVRKVKERKSRKRANIFTPPSHGVEQRLRGKLQRSTSLKKLNIESGSSQVIEVIDVKTPTKITIENREKMQRKRGRPKSTVEVIDVKSPSKVIQESPEKSMQRKAPKITSIPKDARDRCRRKAFIELSRDYFGAPKCTTKDAKIINTFLNLTICSEHLWSDEDISLRHIDLWHLLFGGPIDDSVLYAWMKILNAKIEKSDALSLIGIAFVPPNISEALLKQRRNVFSTLCPGLQHEALRKAYVVYMAINCEFHWIGLEIDYRKETLTFSNSLQLNKNKLESVPSDHYEVQALDVAKFLGKSLHIQYKKASTDKFSIVFGRQCPQQPSSSLACGLYVMQFFDYIILGDAMTLTHEELNDRKPKYCAEILRHCNKLK